MSDYQLPTHIEHDRLDRGYIELEFGEPVPMEGPVFGAINAKLVEIYGTWSDIDWCDEQTCWVWIGANNSSPVDPGVDDCNEPPYDEALVRHN